MFEFITGGGFAGRDLPDSLMLEGAMMLQALVAELKSVADIEPVILLDSRCVMADSPDAVEIHQVAEGQDYESVLKGLMRECDVFWPIAPETDEQLIGLVDLAAIENVTTLLSSRAALQLCASKLATSRHLRERDIAAVDTQYSMSHDFDAAHDWVFKPDDGVGCEGGWLVRSAQEYQTVKRRLEDAAYVVQPFLDGRALSLSCLFKNGRGWLLCRNEQVVRILNSRFQLQACRVNVQDEAVYDYDELVDQVAQAMPGLWGYIGIDLIETEQGPVILEINPRLTTSYVGIQKATGVNVAEQVLRMLGSQPALDKTRDQMIEVNIETGLN